MYRLFIIVVLLLWGAAPAAAAPPNASRATKEADPAIENLPLDADSRETLILFVNARLKQIVPNIATKPVAAEKLANDLMAALDGATTKTASGKQFLAEAKGVVASVQRQIAVARMPLEDVTRALRKNPDDSTALINYGTKIQMGVEAIVEDDPNKAVELVETARKVLAEVQERAEGEAGKNAVGRQLKSLARFDRAINAAKEHAKVLGTDAAPLKVYAWLNGSALTPADLKGKVVLLDFWAVWCGPCIAGFPHLTEWQEKYAAKGLVIVGVTSYYGIQWDDDENGPVRQPTATHEQEREMLAKFAKQHELKHRLTIEIESNLSEHYGVSGIPHLVLIDRQGKVAMIRVGNSERNVRDLSEMIEKLVEGDKKPVKLGEKVGNRK